MATTNTTAASCQHCSTPIDDLGDAKCPSCGQDWAPAGGNITLGSGANAAGNNPADATGTTNTHSSGNSLLPWVLFMLLLVAFVLFYASSRGFIGFTDAGLTIGSSVSSAKAEVWNVDVRGVVAEYRYRIDGKDSNGQPTGVFECRKVGNGSWLRFDLNQLIKQWNAAVESKKPVVLPQECGSIPLKIKK